MGSACGKLKWARATCNLIGSVSKQRLLSAIYFYSQHLRFPVNKKLKIKAKVKVTYSF